jgi:hypothetical protein
MSDKKIQKQNNPKYNQMNNINTQEEQILSQLHKKLDKKHINIPKDESIKILLQNDDIKNMILYTLNKHSEIEQEIKIKKKVSFYFINNQKIDEYIKLKSLHHEKINKISDLKNKLQKIKEQRNIYTTKNETILQEIKDQEKNDKLARIKLKILNNTNNTAIIDLKNEYKKYLYINGYKYSHMYPKKNIGAIIENENEDDLNEAKENFDRIKDDKILNEDNENDNKLKEKNEEQISFISLNDISSSSINDSKINQIINLPKLSQEEVEKYTKYSQKLFFEKIISELNLIKSALASNPEKKLNKKENTDKTDEKSVISMISESSKSKKDNKLQKPKEIIAVENKIKQRIKKEDEVQLQKAFFSEISEKFKNDIQIEELNVSKNYKNKIIEENDDITYKQALEEINILQKKNSDKINNNIFQKIIDITKVKLIIDINDKFIKNKNLKNEKINEIIIPKCIIEKNPQDTLNFYKNVINTYKKYKQRTNNFITKRLFPSLLLLDEKYTDFLTTLINEYDYFSKLKFANIKTEGDNVYSLKKFKYDENLLKKNGIKNKYDLFGFYLSNIFLKKIILDNDTVVNLLNNSKALKHFFEINKKNGDIIKNISNFIKNAQFNEDLNLNFNKEELSLIYDYIKEFLNIDYIQLLNPFIPQ